VILECLSQKRLPRTPHSRSAASHFATCTRTRLGVDWADKKSICNKFLQSTAVTCLVWPKDRPNEVVFGCADGQVKVGLLKSNKVGKIYAHPEGSYVVALASSPNGQVTKRGHAARM
jgi:intraflagellar transport protein 172